MNKLKKVQKDIEAVGNETIEFTIEILKTARDELFMRVKKRDEWLKLHLFSQATLFALSKGIKFGSVEASEITPNLLPLSIIVSLIFTILYIIEERLVGNTSKVIKALYLELPKVKAKYKSKESKNIKDKYRSYAQNTLRAKLLAQLTAFAIIPGYFSLYSYLPIEKFSQLLKLKIILLFFVSAIIIIILIVSHINRSKFEDIYEMILKTEKN